VRREHLSGEFIAFTHKTPAAPQNVHSFRVASTMCMACALAKRGSGALQTCLLGARIESPRLAMVCPDSGLRY